MEAARKMAVHAEGDQEEGRNQRRTSAGMAATRPRVSKVGRVRREEVCDEEGDFPSSFSLLELASEL